MTKKKHTLKHPDTGEVRETNSGVTALQLKVHHGYKDVTDEKPKTGDSSAAPKPGPKN